MNTSTKDFWYQEQYLEKDLAMGDAKRQSELHPDREFNVVYAYSKTHKKHVYYVDTVGFIRSNETHIAKWINGVDELAQDENHA